VFQWLQYKRRLSTIRGELQQLEEEMGTLPTGGLEHLATVAAGVGKIANILGRVIDSLPG
jgi:hypothetical protein